MRVNQYMTASPISIGVDEDYDSAFEIMETKDLHHLPVVNRSGEIVGILTRRDLQLAARFFHEAPAEVAEVMHAPVVTIAQDAKLEEASERMMVQRIGCLPVVDDNRELTGMLTETDLFRALNELLAERG